MLATVLYTKNPMLGSNVDSIFLDIHPAIVDAIREWLAEGDAPTVIIAAYDYVAIGIMRALKEEGYRVPEDFAVSRAVRLNLINNLNHMLSRRNPYANRANLQDQNQA